VIEFIFSNWEIAMRKAIVTKTHRYEVGTRGQYVYWLVQGRSDLSKRGEEVAHYTVEFDLTDEERASLAASLTRLDARRAQRKPPGKSVDPYWSLWGRLKSQHRRLKAIETSDDMEAGGGLRYKCAVADYEDVEAEEYHLPVSGVSVSYDGECVVLFAPDPSWASNIVKSVKSDSHAVNFLRKMDIDAEYLNRQLGK
jgi:hypothetical protein